jgi:hypothetical protein
VHILSNFSSSSDVIATTNNTAHFEVTARTGKKSNKSAFSGNGDASIDQSSGEQDAPERYRPRRDHSHFHVPSAPKEERRAAHNRIAKALE